MDLLTLQGWMVWGCMAVVDLSVCLLVLVLVGVALSVRGLLVLLGVHAMVLMLVLAASCELGDVEVREGR